MGFGENVPFFNLLVHQTLDATKSGKREREKEQ